jgi:hypothetical protein
VVGTPASRCLRLRSRLESALEVTAVPRYRHCVRRRLGFWFGEHGNRFRFILLLPSLLSQILWTDNVGCLNQYLWNWILRLVFLIFPNYCCLFLGGVIKWD